MGFLDKLTGPPSGHIPIEQLDSYRNFDAASEADAMLTAIDQDILLHGRHLWTSNERLQSCAASAAVAVYTDTLADNILASTEKNTTGSWSHMLPGVEFAFVEQAYGVSVSYLEAARKLSTAKDDESFTVDKRFTTIADVYPAWPDETTVRNTFIEGALSTAQYMVVNTAAHVNQLASSPMLPREFMSLAKENITRLNQTLLELEKVKGLWQSDIATGSQARKHVYATVQAATKTILNAAIVTRCPALVYPDAYSMKDPLVIGAEPKAKGYSAELVKLAEAPAAQLPKGKAYDASLISIVETPTDTQPKAKGYNPEAILVVASAQRIGGSAIIGTYSPDALELPKKSSYNPDLLETPTPATPTTPPKKYTASLQDEPPVQPKKTSYDPNKY